MVDNYKLAGFWRRLEAIVLDVLCFYLPLFVLFGLIFGFNDVTEAGVDLISFLYGLLLPVFWRGYVIGKRLRNIRIVQSDGVDVTLWTMVKRVIIAGIVYGITLGIAAIVSAFMVGIREDKRAIHDFIADTYVIDES
ncbi:RDD family protein [Halalkalibacillus sediminis]|uniref:RDD family protein n=1 Tax=Halalkalibacillus sediminis TaxID=2018042 RepID=A0A2I0QS03_9BACI|nr:RDD family protein [Halalkalibacillus sediminis]PKR77122.1 RDD family protein [Halalkalibacillus sediminis]